MSIEKEAREFADAVAGAKQSKTIILAGFIIGLVLGFLGGLIF